MGDKLDRNRIKKKEGVVLRTGKNKNTKFTINNRNSSNVSAGGGFRGGGRAGAI